MGDDVFAKVVVTIMLAVLAFWLIRQYLINSMSNVAPAREANEYLREDTVDITYKNDTYLYTTVTRIAKAQHKDD